MEEPAAIASAFCLFSLLLSSAHCLVDSDGNSGGDRRQRFINSEWQILTKQNFSSEIRLHPHILLMVTIPWSGEARSLMKQVGKLASDQPEKLGHLRLMVVYKNAQKMLADLLGAAEDITLYYYYQSTPYKYQGSFRAEKILFSVNYFMSLRPEEVPLKPLHDENDVNFFLKSTDKAVILIELCGWASKLLPKKSSRNLISPTQLNNPEDDDLFRESLFGRVDERFPFDMKNQKGLDMDVQTCGVENVLTESLWAGEVCWANNSALEGIEYENADVNLSCTQDEFDQFKSFFSKFSMLAEEYLLTPKRIRFGLISERSLLPYVGVDNMAAWLVVLRFNGCLSCSMILKAGDDLRKILQEHQSPAMELDVDRYSLESAFPDNRPSVVLFVDRFSDSSKIREESDSSLEVFRKLSEHYQLSYRMNGGLHNVYPQSSTTVKSESQGTIVSNSPGLHFMKDSLVPKVIKIKDNMALVVKKGQRILSDQTDSYAQGNAVYDVLLDFLNKRKSSKKKQTKISFLAKEIGFQLLSDDFEVQVEDSLAYDKENNQFSDMNKQTPINLGDQTFKLHQQPSGDSEKKYDDLQTSMEVLTVNDAKQAAHRGVEDDIEKYLKTITKDESSTTELGAILAQEVMYDSGSYLEPREGSVKKNDNLLTSVEVDTVAGKKASGGDAKVDIQKYLEKATKGKSNQNELGAALAQVVQDDSGNYFSSLINVDDKICKQNDMGSLMCHDENSSFGEDIFAVETCIEKNSVDDTSCSSCSSEAARNVGLHPRQDIIGNVGSKVDKNMRLSEPNEAHIQRLQPFQGAFFFVDGGYPLLRSLTGESNIPSLVLVDPVEQHHYVFNEDRIIGYSSLVIFLDKFLNGSLSPYQPSASYIVSSKEAPQPPFVNLDFHEVDPIPRVTTNTFCELVFGFKPCVNRNAFPTSQVQHSGEAWKTDVFVLFGSPWCGFCQRMELIVREVHQAFRILKNMLKYKSSAINPVGFQGDVAYTLPSVLLMDCSLNDCSYFLKPVGKNELYPELLLYPAQNKSAIPYEGEMMVVNIIKFLASQGRNSQYLNKYKGYLWKHTLNSSKKKVMSHDTSSVLTSKVDPDLDGSIAQNLRTAAVNQPPASPAQNSFHSKGQRVIPGSVLSATDKLQQAIPFENSTILITFADEGRAFQGVIINKPITWNIFENLDKDLEPIKQAPLFYGGPVWAEGLPLVSLAKIPTEGYTEVIPGVCFGNPVITSMVVEGIKSGDRSPHDYWFFLGYSSWTWDQLFVELAEGAWHLSDHPAGSLTWPNN